MHFLKVVTLLLALSPVAYAQEHATLVDSTYMDRGSVALALRSLPVAGKAVSLAGVEWSWAARPHFNIGLAIASATTPVQVSNPSDDEQHKEASFTQVAARAETEVFSWRVISVAPDLEVGSAQVGYRGHFSPGNNDWHTASAPYATLGATTYLHISPETDLGLAVGYQKTRPLELRGFAGNGTSGAALGLRLRRWF